MRILTWEEAIQAEKYMQEAAKVALSATCERSKCWSVIVKNWKNDKMEKNKYFLNLF